MQMVYQRHPLSIADKKNCRYIVKWLPSKCFRFSPLWLLDISILLHWSGIKHVFFLPRINNRRILLFLLFFLFTCYHRILLWWWFSFREPSFVFSHVHICRVFCSQPPFSIDSGITCWKLFMFLSFFFSFYFIYIFFVIHLVLSIKLIHFLAI